MDESGFSHDTPRTHGYSPKGHRCFGLKNWGAKGRTNVIARRLNFDYSICIKNRSSIVHPVSIFLRLA
ncbi:hypothetical protein [Candidatus Arsenophonus triatominarum]|uniref:hypothetical protein n=1 Tax=Candidatus Arsenophonus triatominarum TaxID=57911 RepID=UPI003CCBCFD5